MRLFCLLLEMLRFVVILLNLSFFKKKLKVKLLDQKTNLLDLKKTEYHTVTLLVQLRTPSQVMK